MFITSTVVSWRHKRKIKRMFITSSQLQSSENSVSTIYSTTKMTIFFLPSQLVSALITRKRIFVPLVFSVVRSTNKNSWHICSQNFQVESQLLKSVRGIICLLCQLYCSQKEVERISICPLLPFQLQWQGIGIALIYHI